MYKKPNNSTHLSLMEVRGDDELLSLLLEPAPLSTSDIKSCGGRREGRVEL